MAKSYDSKSYELAAYFLADVMGLKPAELPCVTHMLALQIQGTIEDFLEELEVSIERDRPREPQSD
jgi:hypothetical protein